MYHIELYNKKEELVGDFYINPAAVASMYKNVKEDFVTGRLFNGQAFVIPAENFEELKNLVDQASGGGKKHNPDDLPFRPVDMDVEPLPDKSNSNGSLAQVNHNLAYIWANTRDGKRIKLTPEELEGKVVDIQDAK